MRKIIKIFISALLIIASTAASAQDKQDKSSFNLSWDLGFGITSDNTFNTMSISGFSLSNDVFIGNHLSVGGKVASQTFYTDNDPVSPISHNDIKTTTRITHNLSVISLLATAKFYYSYPKERDYPMISDTKIIGFIGLGVGPFHMATNDKTFETETSFIITDPYFITTIDKVTEDSTITNGLWRFGLSPEIGISIPLQYHFNITANYRFNYAFGDLPVYWSVASFGVCFIF